MTSLSFMSCCPAMVKRFFAKPAFDWMNQPAKDYVLAHLAKSDDEQLLTGFRVYDPDFHPAQIGCANKCFVEEFNNLQNCDIRNKEAVK